MGILKCVVRVGTVLIVLFAALLCIPWQILSKPSMPPTVPLQYWGPGKPRPDNTAIVAFKINVTNHVLSDLEHRLKALPPVTSPLEDANFRYGFNTDTLEELIKFWLTQYNWREREAFLNSLPQFKTQVAGLNIHYIHVKPSTVPPGVKVLPLLIMHGWPGSVREFYDLIPLLTTPRNNIDFVFEVVAPSLPGYGFSDGASKQGLGGAQAAVVMKSLMNRLGFNQFYVQGGDFGSIIGSAIAILFPDSVLGFHSNLCATLNPFEILKKAAVRIWPRLFLSEIEVSRFKSFGEELFLYIEESGYFHIQATKPDTIGTALTTSPVGLAAYILEKFSTGTNVDWRSLPDGGLNRKFTLTNLLDNVMIYWITGSMTTAVRLYSETFNKAHTALNLERMLHTVPTACVWFPHEIAYVPEFILKDRFINLVQVSYPTRGGHFAAFEEPVLLSEDIWTAVQKMRKFVDRTQRV